MTKEYNYVSPPHYKKGGKETWEEMLEIWGTESFITHCEITAYKYISRLGKKPSSDIKTDIAKARWYLNKAEELRQ